MAKPKWQEKLQAKLDGNPMCFVSGSHVVKHVKCLLPSEKQGRRITLRQAVNFSNHTCAACGITVR